MNDDRTRHRHSAQPVDGSWVQFQRALIAQFLQDVLFDAFDRALRIDEVIVKDFLQRFQRFPGLFLERVIALPGQGFIVIGGPVFAEGSNAGAPHFFVVRQRFASAFELPRDGFLFVDEEHHDVDGGMPKMNAQRRAEEFAPQCVHFVDEKFESIRPEHWCAGIHR